MADFIKIVRGQNKFIHLLTSANISLPVLVQTSFPYIKGQWQQRIMKIFHDDRYHDEPVTEKFNQ